MEALTQAPNNTTVYYILVKDRPDEIRQRAMAPRSCARIPSPRNFRVGIHTMMAHRLWMPPPAVGFAIHGDARI